MPERPHIAVLVPCYNEEAAIGRVVGDFRAALPDATVYVYDNNSRDRTAEIALTMTFNQVQSDVSFWYTSSFGFVVTVYDASHNLLLTLPESGNVNLITDVGSDNFLDIFHTGVASVTITDDSGLGNFLTIDDLTAAGVTGLPAPDATSTLALLGVAGFGLLMFRRKITA